MTIEILSSDKLEMCAVCVSETSGGQIALLVIIFSFLVLGLLRSSWKKYFKKNYKLVK